MRWLAAASVLILCPSPCRAGIGTYDFIETSGPSGPSKVGATLTYSSPSMSPIGPWSSSSAGDIVAFKLLDGAVGRTGDYNSFTNCFATSSDGSRLDSGAIFADNVRNEILSTVISPGGTSYLYGRDNTAQGRWVLAQAAQAPVVPEPAAFRLLGIGVVVVGLIAYRRSRRLAT